MLNDTFDELQQEVQMLDSLLNDRQVDSSSWCICLKERIDKIKAISARLGM